MSLNREGIQGAKSRFLLLATTLLVLIYNGFLGLSIRFRTKQGGPTASKDLILIGVTGSGKSTFGNTLLGSSLFEVGHSLASCTTETTSRENSLFGDHRLGVKLKVSDTGGLGDTENRDVELVEGILNHVRSQSGVHGVVYVHNACNARFDQQTQKAMAAMIAMLTDDSDSQKRLKTNGRLSLVMTTCTDWARRKLYEAALPGRMCNLDASLCNVPIFWYDDHDIKHSWTTKLFRLLLPRTGRSAWRNQFEEWVRDLPSHKMILPSKTDFEKQQDRQRMLEDKMPGLETSRGCFSGNSQVVERSLGLIPMKTLKVGHEVKTSEGGWSTVTTFLHWHPTESIQALSIEHDEGTLTIAHDHLVFVIDENGDVQAIPAKEVLPGSRLLASNGNAFKEVRSVSKTSMGGYYAPLTSSGTIVVDGVAASCYAQHGRHSFTHWTMNVAMMPLRGWVSSTLSYTPQAGSLHPFARFLLMFW